MLLLMFWAVCGLTIWGVEHYRTIVAQQRQIAKRLIEEEEYRKLVVDELQHRLKNKTSTIHAVLHQVAAGSAAGLGQHRSPHPRAVGNRRSDRAG